MSELDCENCGCKLHLMHGDKFMKLESGEKIAFANVPLLVCGGCQKKYIPDQTKELLDAFQRILEDNVRIDETLFAIVSRYRRIETTKDNRNMAVFREEFERYLSYKIVPIYMNKAGLEPLFDYEIEKTEIYFRKVDDISQRDVDAVCIKSLHK